jgi:hypothetical protein
MGGSALDHKEVAVSRCVRTPGLCPCVVAALAVATLLASPVKRRPSRAPPFAASGENATREVLREGERSPTGEAVALPNRLAIASLTARDFASPGARDGSEIATTTSNHRPDATQVQGCAGPLALAQE